MTIFSKKMATLARLASAYRQIASELGFYYSINIKEILETNSMNCIWTALSIIGLKAPKRFMNSPASRPIFDRMGEIVLGEIPFGSIVEFSRPTLKSTNREIFHAAIVIDSSGNLPKKIIHRPGYERRVVITDFESVISEYNLKNCSPIFRNAFEHYETLYNFDAKLAELTEKYPIKTDEFYSELQALGYNQFEQNYVENSEY